MTTDDFVRAHRGVLEDDFSRAHLGRLFTLDAPIVVVPPKVFPKASPRRSSNTAAAGGGPTLSFEWLQEQIDETQLEQAVEAVVVSARTLEVQQWVTRTVEAERTPMDSEILVASALLKRAQSMSLEPLPKLVLFASAVLASGMSVRLMLHVDVTGGTHAVTAVYADGQWHFADPSHPLVFGAVAPFVSSRTFEVPDLPEPQQVAYAKSLQEYDRYLAQCQANAEAQAVLIAKQIELLDTQPAVQTIVVVERRQSLLPYVVVFAVLGVSWLLYKKYKTPDEVVS